MALARAIIPAPIISATMKKEALIQPILLCSSISSDDLEREKRGVFSPETDSFVCLFAFHTVSKTRGLALIKTSDRQHLFLQKLFLFNWNWRIHFVVAKCSSLLFINSLGCRLQPCRHLHSRRDLLSAYLQANRSNPRLFASVSGNRRQLSREEWTAWLEIRLNSMDEREKGIWRKTCSDGTENGSRDEESMHTTTELGSGLGKGSVETSESWRNRLGEGRYRPLSTNLCFRRSQTGISSLLLLQESFLSLLEERKTTEAFLLWAIFEKARSSSDGTPSIRTKTAVKLATLWRLNSGK